MIAQINPITGMKVISTHQPLLPRSWNRLMCSNDARDHDQ